MAKSLRPRSDLASRFGNLRVPEAPFFESKCMDTPPDSSPTPPPPPAAREQALADVLATQKSFANWAYNPWAHPDSEEAKATAIANRFLQRFTDDLMQKGYMPVCGVEVNAVIEGRTNSKEIVAILRKLVTYYDGYVHYQPAVRAAADAFAATPLLLSDAPQAPNEPFSIKHSLRRLATTPESIQTMLHTLQNTQEILQQKGWITKERLFHTDSTIKFLEDSTHLPAPFNPALRTRYNQYKHLFLDTLMQAHDPEIAMGPNDGKLENDFTYNGRIYVDTKDELEICTRASSPLETAHSVNSIKQMLVEASYDFSALYANLVGLKSDDQPVDVPRSALGAYLQQHASHSFNAYFGNEKANCGEHVSVSLQRRKSPEKNYDNMRLFQDAMFRRKDANNHSDKYFAANNLAHNDGWHDLLTEAFKAFLPNDTLLATGNSKFLNVVANHTNPAKQNIKTKGRNNGATARIELRSYNDASSNISFSLLGVTAVIYAVIKEIERHPQLNATVQANPYSLTNDDIATILMGLKTHYQPNELLPSTLSGATERYHSSSLTSAMMREWVADHAASPQEQTEMLAEVEAFESMVTNIAKDKDDRGPTANKNIYYVGRVDPVYSRDVSR